MIDTLRKGMVFALKTRPYSKYAFQDTKRHVAIHILKDIGQCKDTMPVAVLDRVFENPPSLPELCGLKVMPRFASANFSLPFQGPSELVLNIFLDSEFQDYFQFLGQKNTTEQEDALTGISTTYCNWSAISTIVERTWRDKHDETAFSAELVQLRADALQFQKKQEKRQKERLNGLTIETLLSETQLLGWEDRTEFIPVDFIVSIRVRCRKLLLELSSFAVKIGKRDARKSLRSFVDWVNNHNDHFGGAIVETQEREDIHAFLEEVCWAVKHEALVHEVEDWREW